MLQLASPSCCNCVEAVAGTCREAVGAYDDINFPNTGPAEAFGIEAVRKPGPASVRDFLACASVPCIVVLRGSELKSCWNFASSTYHPSLKSRSLMMSSAPAFLKSLAIMPSITSALYKGKTDVRGKAMPTQIGRDSGVAVSSSGRG